jgi:NAD-dependent deacetylase
MAPDADALQRAARWLREAREVVVFSGAGASAESGIPTFRGAGGLWRTYRAEDLATPEAFAHDPKLVWEWYDSRRSMIATAEPNAGHRALAELQRKMGITLATQNVDGLHDRAGSSGILKLHGDIWTLRCTGCGSERADQRPKHCPVC